MSSYDSKSNLGTSTATLVAASAGTEAGALGEQYERLHGAKLLSALAVPDGDEPLAAQFMVLPTGLRIESLKKIVDEVRPYPERRKGTATLQDLASFVAHVNRFKDADSVIFADRNRSAPKLTAIFDYNQAGGIADADARWGTHRAVYPAPLSDEWKAWHAKEGAAMDMQSFAEFLNERIGDVLPAPTADDATLAQWAELVGGRFASPSQLLTLSRNLEVNVGSSVKQALTLESGEVSVVYTEQHTDGTGNPVRIPNLFLIGLPVFFNGERYTIPVRLRYRMAGGKVSWSYTLHQAQRVFDHAFAEVCDRAGEDTTLPVFVGAPEV